jgi:peroxiredoxin
LLFLRLCKHDCLGRFFHFNIIEEIGIGAMTTTSLQDQLDEITANTRHLVQAERLAVGERAVAELFASGIEERILPVGALAPEFALKDTSGRVVRSADLLALGPLVIKFFRGRWCSYCVTELEAWRDLYGTLREREGLLVEIGPQIERQSDFMAGQHGLPFPVLSDPGNALAEKFGLVYTIPEYHRAYYLSILVNIPFVNGEKSWRLPVPATYVIARDRRVLFAEAHADFRVRPEPEEALAAAFAHHNR